MGNLAIHYLAMSEIGAALIKSKNHGMGFQEVSLKWASPGEVLTDTNNKKPQNLPNKRKPKHKTLRSKIVFPWNWNLWIFNKLKGSLPPDLPHYAVEKQKVPHVVVRQQVPAATQRKDTIQVDLQLSPRRGNPVFSLVWKANSEIFWTYTTAF